MSPLVHLATRFRHAARPVLALFTTALVLGGCDGGTRLTAPDKPATSSTSCGAVDRIQIIPVGAQILQGRSEGFSAIAYDAAGCEVSTFFTWSSSNPSVASVSGGGTFAVVQGGQPGYAFITAAVGAVTASVQVQVIARVPSRVTITPATWSMQPGETVQYSARVFDQRGGEMFAIVNWSSDAPSIATIGSNGVATGVSQGNTTIRATAGSAQATASLGIRYALFVDVIGPHHVDYAGDYTYEAHVEGGDGNYTYVWSVDYGNGQHLELGGGSSKTIHIAQGWGEALVRVVVYSAGIWFDSVRLTTNGIGCDGDYCTVN